MFQGVAGDYNKKNHGKDVKYNQIDVKELLLKLDFIGFVRWKRPKEGSEPGRLCSFQSGFQEQAARSTAHQDRA